MIELIRSHEAPSQSQVKAIGVGDAGTRVLDLLSREGLAGVGLAVANTDARALSGSVTPERISLGVALTRGLGTGGDPDLGRAASEESMDALLSHVANAGMVVLVAGLGGGTGSGSVPCIAEALKARGIGVVVVASLPFPFEGKRRAEQAAAALESLRGVADLVVCFESQRVAAFADPGAAVDALFSAMDTLASQAVRALVAVSRRKGVMQSGLSEVASFVASSDSEVLLGYGTGEGEDRARYALRRALESPLLDQSGRFSQAQQVFVCVAGGGDLRWAEIQNLMTELLEKAPEGARIFWGASVDPQLGGAVAVTLLAGLGEGSLASQVAYSAPSVSVPAAARQQPTHSGLSARVSPPPQVAARAEEPAETASATSGSAAARSETKTPPYLRAMERQREKAETAAPVDLPLVNPPETVAVPKEQPAPSPVEAVDREVKTEELPLKVESAPAPAKNENTRRVKESVQEQMHFEPVNRGRFEKTDPTIVDGEDLDVPTFMRQRLNLE